MGGKGHELMDLPEFNRKIGRCHAIRYFPSCGVEGLPKARNHQGATPKGRDFDRTHMAMSVKDHVLIDFIRQHVKIESVCQRCDVLKRFPVNETTTRIVGGINNE